MAKKGLDKVSVIAAAAELANEKGLDELSLKDLANRLEIRSPSLYNHISGLDELKREIMLYGWEQLGDEMLKAAEEHCGYDAIKAMCRAFYRYAAENKGVFGAMLWYNKYADEDSMNATVAMFSQLYKTLGEVGISREMAEHLIRTLRGFLEGFSLLVNNGAFGHLADVNESFELSLDVLVEGMKAAAERGKANE